jgi:hypothetical protein
METRDAREEEECRVSSEQWKRRSRETRDASRERRVEGQGERSAE